MDKRGYITLALASGIVAVGALTTVGIMGNKWMPKKDHDAYVSRTTNEIENKSARISVLNEEKKELNQNYETSIDSIASLNEEVAKKQKAASWYHSKVNELEPLYEQALDSINFLVVENDNLTCEKDNLLECLDEKKTAYNQLTEVNEKLNLALANRNWQIEEYQDSLDTAHKYLHVYVVNDWCIPPVQERHMDRNYLPDSEHFIPDSKEAVKFIKNQNKLYKADQEE